MLEDNIADQLSILDALDAEEDKDTQPVQQDESVTDSVASDLERLDALDAGDDIVDRADVEEASVDTVSQLNELDALDGGISATAEVPVAEVEETPIEQYARTGDVPEGFRVMPSVPTGDEPEDYLPKLERIDAPTPTVSEQTDAAFDYDKTKAMFSALYGKDSQGREFFDKDFDLVPAPLRGFSQFIAEGGEEVLGLIALGVTAAGETAEDTGEAITRFVHEQFGEAGKKALPFDPKTAGRKFGTDLTMMLEMAEAVNPAYATAGATVRKVGRDVAKEAKKKVRGEAARKALLERKMNINQAKEATAEETAKKADEAAKIAEQNDDLRQALIEDFERTTGKTISIEVKGKKVLDEEAARKAGIETAQEIGARDTRSSLAKKLGVGEAEVDEAGLLAGQADSIVDPRLKADKLNGLVAAAAELKKKHPDAFNNDKTIIDNLLDLTINKELIAGDELLDTLNKYNVSFEDYILTVVGSGSEAGKTLQKLSQIRRMRPSNEMAEMQRVATQAQQGKIRNTIMRLEGIRRGGLVSQIATAARNVTSAGIRAPLDTLANVMDTALYNAGEVQGLGRKTKAFTGSVLSGANWADSFRHMKYMFGPESRLDTKDYVDFILDRPELAKQYDLMFNQLNELQKATGRGQATTRFGKVVDGTLSELEDAVSVLNSANRWQEYLVRRGSFLGELERLVKREYKIDLIDALNEGKITDLLNDASSVRPKNARSFNELVADATNKALDVTYAKQPETAMFREITSFITRNGLTVVIPFPRFMFNSLELMGNYMGGASIPLAKKMMGMMPEGAKLSAKDRQRISRNLVGIAGIGAAYMARSGEDAPADYKEISVGDGTVMDTTPQFPLRQYLYLGEATKRIMDGTFDDFFDLKEFSETFLGTNIRTGVGNSIIEEVVALSDGTDLTNDEQAGRAIGSALGNYLSTWAVPFAQIIDTERALGNRGETYKDVAPDPTLSRYESLKANIVRPFEARGFTLTPAEEAAMPTRQGLFQEKPSRVASALKVGLGLSLKTQDNEQGEYIKRLGMSEFELGSSSKVPSIRRFENEQLREIIPGLVDAARAYEEQSRIEYRENKALQEDMTEQEFVNSRVKPLIKEQIKSAKKMLTDGKTVAANAPAYIEAMLAYRRLSPELRKGAASEFIAINGRPADGSSMEDLYQLGEIGKVLKDAYK